MTTLAAIGKDVKQSIPEQFPVLILLLNFKFKFLFSKLRNSILDSKTASACNPSMEIFVYDTNLDRNYVGGNNERIVYFCSMQMVYGEDSIITFCKTSENNYLSEQ